MGKNYAKSAWQCGIQMKMNSTEMVCVSIYFNYRQRDKIESINVTISKAYLSVMILGHKNMRYFADRTGEDFNEVKLL